MDFRGPQDNMDFYYCVKIRTHGFSTCGGFGGGEKFFFFFLPRILYKDRKTNGINICLVLRTPKKLLFLQCLLIASKPLLCWCSKPFWWVPGQTNGVLQHVVSRCSTARSVTYVVTYGCYRDDAVSPSLILVGLPSIKHAARPVFFSTSNLFSKNRLASCVFVCGNTCACSIITLLPLFALCWDPFSETLVVFIDFSN